MSFKIAWRSPFKNKSFTLINLWGLAASLLWLIYVANEWKFNSQYNNPESIFEVKSNQLNDAQEIVITGDPTPNALVPTLLGPVETHSSASFFRAVLMVLFSAILAVIFVELSLPFFNNLLQIKLSGYHLGKFE